VLINLYGATEQENLIQDLKTKDKSSNELYTVHPPFPAPTHPHVAKNQIPL
jgi:hypothetical protein